MLAETVEAEAIDIEAEANAVDEIAASTSLVIIETASFKLEYNYNHLCKLVLLVCEASSMQRSCFWRFLLNNYVQI